MVVFGPDFVDFRTVIFIKSFGFLLHGKYEVVENFKQNWMVRWTLGIPQFLTIAKHA
jgi:hypothetical protein